MWSFRTRIAKEIISTSNPVKIGCISIKAGAREKVKMMSLKSSVAMGDVTITSCGVVPNNAEMVGGWGPLGGWGIGQHTVYQFLKVSSIGIYGRNYCMR